MDPVTLLRMAVDSIAAHKLRSALVTLGILIGVTAVLVNAAMVQGFQVYFEQQIKTLGSNFLTVRPPTSIGLFGPQLQEDISLESYLYDSVRRLPYIDDATASRSAFGKIRYMGTEEDVYIIGIESNYLQARNRNIIVGDTLAPQDSFNAVVGESVLESSLRPLALQSQFELTVTVNRKKITEKFRVKGIVEELQDVIGLGIGTIYVPVRTLNTMLGTEGYDEITLFATDVDQIELVEAETREMLDRLLKAEPDRGAPVEEDVEGFLGFSPKIALGEEKYAITTQSDVLDISNEITSIIQLVLVAIAGISLLVGGIGIANVMLVTVTERTREIGVMKAVGAKNRHVLTMFLFEAVVIGLLGGFLGLVISAVATFTMVPLLYDVSGSMSLQWIAIAIGISLAISLLSGLYPAIRASKMDPVEALRSE